ncbi:MAG: glycosyltransferase family 61 protein [Chloroflexota bacterium]|nr:glycosyltransferase family 61 protein [Chloroflexota bacterium]
MPSRTMGSQEYAARSGARWRQAERAAPIERKPPLKFGALPGDFEGPRLATRFPDMGVLELPHGLLVGARGWVVTDDGYLLPDHTLFAQEPSMPAMGAPRVTRLKGVVASLATDNAWRNYGHFLYDGLGRFELLRRAGYSVDEIDWFLCTYPGKKARRLVERLGIPPEKIVRSDAARSVRGDLVLAPTFPGARRDHPRWLIEFLRRDLLPTPRPAGPPRRLYVRRTTSRRVANEAEIMPILTAHGFVAFDPVEDPEPPVAFSQAEGIVGVHGANLADICFCPDGAGVLEFTPTEHINSYWYAQAETAGLRYGYIVCRSTSERAAGATRASDADVHVDPDELREALAVMFPV